MPNLTINTLRHFVCMKHSASDATNANYVHSRWSRRRQAFAAVHFKKEEYIKQLEKAVSTGDVGVIDGICGNVDLKELEEDGVSFVKTSYKKDNVEVLKALLRHGANANGFGEGSRGALHLAAQSNNLAMAKILLLYGANVNLATKYDLQSPLHLAVKQGNSEMVELLLRHKANGEQRDLYGGQALHMACHMGNIALVSLIVNNTSEIDSYDRQGWTALHFAVVGGHRHIVTYLISRNASVDTQSQYGRTALHWACAKDDPEMVRTLLEAKADPNIRDTNGNLPMDFLAKSATQSTNLMRSIGQAYLQKPPCDTFVTCVNKNDVKSV